MGGWGSAACKGGWAGKRAAPRPSITLHPHASVRQSPMATSWEQQESKKEQAARWPTRLGRHSPTAARSCRRSMRPAASGRGGRRPPAAPRTHAPAARPARAPACAHPTPAGGVVWEGGGVRAALPTFPSNTNAHLLTRPPTHPPVRPPAHPPTHCHPPTLMLLSTLPVAITQSLYLHQSALSTSCACAAMLREGRGCRTSHTCGWGGVDRVWGCVAGSAWGEGEGGVWSRRRGHHASAAAAGSRGGQAACKQAGSRRDAGTAAWGERSTPPGTHLDGAVTRG